jgi:hypothetical protein
MLLYICNKNKIDAVGVIGYISLTYEQIKIDLSISTELEDIYLDYY